jgi:rare lipoprotein A
MRNTFHLNRLAGFLALWIIGNWVPGFSSSNAHAARTAVPQHSKWPSKDLKAKLDLSGRNRVGNASIYAGKFAGKKMADGTRMNPHSDNAASNTLPLGTTAKVTNLQTGQSAKVTIRDRGPYVKGRILDISPSTAHKIGVAQHKGVAKVKVDPLAVPIANRQRETRRRGKKAKANKSNPGARGQ